MSPSLTAMELRNAAWPDGEIIGDEHRRSYSACSLNALHPGCLSFMSWPLAASRLAALKDRLDGVTIFCEQGAVAEMKPFRDTTLIVVANARLAFMRAVACYFAPNAREQGIHPTAVVHASAEIHSGAVVGPFCMIGPGCIVGADCTLAPHVVLMQDVQLGCRVSIGAGTVIGADGFGYERNEAGELEKFPHIGGVVIGDDVEIGSNTSIDRGTLDSTRIGLRARIDNQVHIAHNVIIGADAAIIAQAMIGGSARIGDRAWIAPSATIMNQVSVGADATVGLGAVVVQSVPDDATVMGSPAQSSDDFRRTRAALKRIVSDAG